MKKERRIPVAIAVVLLILPIQYAINTAILTSFGHTMPNKLWILRTMFNFANIAVLGLVAGVIVSAVRREFRYHLRVLRSWPWIATTFLLIVGVSVLGYEYGLLKITVHLVRNVNYDAILWEIDRWMMLGISPNVFLLESLSHPVFYKTFDWLYAFGFAMTMFGSFVLLFGWRNNNDRIGYLAGSTVLWLSGAWLYLAVPSLGPAYAFYEVWDGVRHYFPVTNQVQKMLIENHLLVRRLAEGERNLSIHIHLGIAAFPSLHVGFHAHFAFWLQRLVPRLRLLGWILLAIVFIGSVITGWHYVIDSIAGLILGWLGWRVGAWVAGPRRSAAPPAADVAPVAAEEVAGGK
ncbi:MAG TPA: phosphatase PAP2 family protein [Thermoanaerobaculia bacterium]|nr:phosphatase PAP2 family protein [Thermoanaerobaculia bacterium]